MYLCELDGGSLKVISSRVCTNCVEFNPEVTHYETSGRKASEMISVWENYERKIIQSDDGTYVEFKGEKIIFISASKQLLSQAIGNWVLERK